MRALKKNILCRQEGQSLVEFALVLPILILIILGIVEFGRLWMTVNVLTSASREGARVAVVTTPDVSAVQARVNNVLASANISGSKVTVSGPNLLNEVTVTVQLNYTTVSGSIIPGLNSTISLVRSSVMRYEG